MSVTLINDQSINQLGVTLFHNEQYCMDLKYLTQHLLYTLAFFFIRKMVNISGTVPSAGLSVLSHAVVNEKDSPWDDESQFLQRI